MLARMKFSFTNSLRALTGIGATVAAAASKAAGPGTTVSYEPLAAAAGVSTVPTLSGWRTLGLVAVIGFIANRVLSKRAGVRSQRSFWPPAWRLGAAAWHIRPHLTSASASPFATMDQPGWGNVVFSGVGEFPVKNTTTVPMKIVSMNSIYLLETPVGTPQCAEGVLVQAHGFCYIKPTVPD